ncbi:hypothetical protein BGZ68_002103 [Mortierella alpina]|nr:hypothetical protein BGZ68_002103 [Mortierella alpina]
MSDYYDSCQSAGSSWSVGHAGTASNRDSSVAPDEERRSSIAKRPNSVWRFSRILFDAATKPALRDDPSYDTDFDDAANDEDDEEEEDDIEDDAERHFSYLAPNTTPRASVTSPSINNQRRSVFLSEYQPRLLKVRELDNENTIEQVSALEDPPSSPSFLDSVARSHPSLLALSPTRSPLTVVDHPLSTSTFNARLHPISMMRSIKSAEGTEHDTAGPGKDGSFATTTAATTTATTTPISAMTTTTTRRKPGQLRPRPWSQVIWQSPVLGEVSRQQVSQHRRIGSSELDAVCPAPPNTMCSNDAILPAKSKGGDGDKGKDVDTNVRINIERDFVDTGVTSGGRSSLSHALLPLVSSTSRREPIHGRSVQKNRLSLGSAFYASLEPVSLSAATPFTPRISKRQHLIRLPVRPQSVLIPSSPRPYSQGPTFQPVAIESSKRQRHRSQQLDMVRGKSPLPVPIPWAQFQRLAPMTPQDNSHTFHGLGSLPTVPPPLPRGGSQDGPLEGSASVPVWPESLNSPKLQSPPKQATPFKLQQQQPQWQGQTPRRQRSSRFLSALFESPSSFFKKPSLSSSQPSSAVSSPKSGVLSHSPAFTYRFRGSSRNPEVSDVNQQGYTLQPARHEQQQQRYRLPMLQTRQSLPARASNNNNNNSNNSSTGTGGQSSSKASIPAPPPITSTSTTPPKTSSLWQRNSSSALFPFSLVSYESGGLLGGIKNTSSTICTNAPSSVIAPGTPLPPGTVVTTGVPSPPTSQRSVKTNATIVSSSARSSRSNSGASESYTGPPDQCPSTTAVTLTEGESLQRDVVLGSGEGGGDGERWENEANEDTHDYKARLKTETRHDSTMVLDGSVLIQKSHVAVYEINPRWGSRLIMLLVTLGGLLCVVSGGLCAEHHCRDLQLCSQDYQTHGDWCGPSGKTERLVQGLIC